MTGERLTERDTEAIRLYVEERLTLKEVGARLGVSLSTAWDILQKAGVSRRRKGPRWGKWTRRHEEIARAYVEEGLTLEEVGRRFGLSPSTVFYVLQKAGVGGRRRRGRDLTQRNQDIARLYLEERLTLGEIGERFDVSQKWVRRILKRLGVSLRRRSRGPPEPEHLRGRNEEIARLYAEGDLTLREIGERFNLSRERVRQIAKRAGVTLRVARRPRVPAERLRERNAEIIRLYAEGLKRKEIAGRVGASQTVVDYAVRTAGVNRRRPGIGGWKNGTPLLPAEDRRNRNQEIVRLYVEEGLTLREVGACIGMSDVGVLYVLETAGVRRRERWWRPGWPWRDATERTEEITRAYLHERLTLRQVGARFGLSRSCVRLILIRAGVPRRSGPRPRLV